MEIDSVEVSWLGSGNWALLEQLFSKSAGVVGCWCIWPRVPRGQHRPDERANRRRMREIVESGDSPGLLAVAGGRAAGWCAFGPRADYPQYRQESVSGAWAIPCIFIPRSPDEGEIARVLIRFALEHAKSHDAGVVEGPPVRWLPGDAAATKRAIGFFLDNGFLRHGDGERMPVLRYRLA